MNPWLFIPAAFLCGSIPFGMLIARARGIDIRAHGSGNIGATNVGRVLGRTWGVAVFALDVCKGLAPVLVAGAALGTLGHIAAPARDAWLVLATAAAAILGHVFCPWLRFKGGKGVATSLGALAGVFPVLTIAVALAARHAHGRRGVGHGSRSAAGACVWGLCRRDGGGVLRHLGARVGRGDPSDRGDRSAGRGGHCAPPWEPAACDGGHGAESRMDWGEDPARYRTLTASWQPVENL